MAENKITTQETEQERVERELREKVGAKMDKSALTGANIFKFLFFAIVGIVCFFVNVTIGDKSGVPMVLIVNLVKGAIKAHFDVIVTVICAFIFVGYVIGKFIKKDGFFGKFFVKDGIVNGVLYLIAIVVCILCLFNVGPAAILDGNVGPEAVYLGGSCLVTCFVAGWLVNFLTEFGLLEFLGVLISPMMRRLYKLPGESAIDALSSFVAAPAVGVFITNKLYNEKVYTKKEASCIMTNFSVVSLGLFALICSNVDRADMYGKVVLTSLICAFIMAAIVIRIWPLSKKADTYVDGTVQSPEMRKPGKYTKDTLSEAFTAGVTKARDGSWRILYTCLGDVLGFTLKIVAFVVAVGTIVLWLGFNTPVFNWLGIPMIPYLNLCQVPDAAVVAPSTLIGISEVLLPSMLIAGKDITECAVFFVCVLSTVQIIFFDESANAMLASDVEWKAWELVAIFLIRTLIAIPMVSIFAHIFFPV